jgi:Protein of unknown function (DUF433)
VEQLDRITQNPEVMGGKPCVRGVRVTVGMIVGQIGAGRSIAISSNTRKPNRTPPAPFFLCACAQMHRS